MKQTQNGGPSLEARWAVGKVQPKRVPLHISKVDDELGLYGSYSNKTGTAGAPVTSPGRQCGRCGWRTEKLNLPHTEREAQDCESNQRWNDDVLAEVASEEARRSCGRMMRRKNPLRIRRGRGRR